MRLPRFSIALLMAALVLLAIDFATIRSQLREPHPYILLFVAGFLPMANMLALALGLATVRGARRGEVTPFLFGFLSFGGVALFAFTLFSFSSVIGRSSLKVFQISLEAFTVGSQPFLDAVKSMGLSGWESVIHVALYGLICLVPQLLIGLAGGLVGRRFGIRVLVGRDPAGSPGLARARLSEAARDA